MGPLEVVAVPPFSKKKMVKLLFFPMMTSSLLKSWCFFLETKLYKNGGQGLPGFTISDRPKNCWMSYHVLTGSLYYQPKQCTILKGIPKITIHLPCLILPNLMCQKKACPQTHFFWDDFSTWSDSKKIRFSHNESEGQIKSSNFNKTARVFQTQKTPAQILLPNQPKGSQKLTFFLKIPN